MITIHLFAHASGIFIGYEKFIRKPRFCPQHVVMSNSLACDVKGFEWLQ
jgi:hypothetical protein